MTKTKTTNGKLDFYRPHDRAATQWKNEMVDPITGEITNPPSMTKQSFAAECDINNILQQFSVTGMFNHVNANAAAGRYIDLPDEVDFQVALDLVMRAEESFDTLPSKLRSRFNNNPAEFLQFCSDPANQAELVELGLATAPPPQPSDDPPPSPPDANTGVQG